MNAVFGGSQSVGSGRSNLPSAEKAEEEFHEVMKSIHKTARAYATAASPELQAFYAQVLSEKTGSLSMAAHILQRAAYAQATNPQAVENLPSDPSRAE